EPPELVESVLVGPERPHVTAGRTGRARRQTRLQRLGQGLVRVVEERPTETKKDEEDDDPEADKRDLVFGELAKSQPPTARDRQDLAALGDRPRRELIGRAVWHGGPDQRFEVGLGQIRILGSATVTAMSAIRLPSTVR